MAITPTLSTTPGEMDRIIDELQNQKSNWVSVPVNDRIRMLEAIIRAFSLLCEQWVRVSLEAKGALQDSYAAGWEWGSGPMPIMRFLRGLKRTLQFIELKGYPPQAAPLVKRHNRQISVKVYPTNLYERLSTPGTTAEVWMEPGYSEEDVLNTQAWSYKRGERVGRVCLVLGAGNLSCIPVNDSLTKLFIENYVVLLKMNPVNDYLGPLIETIFNPLISQGYFKLIYGGSTEGAYLCNHPNIDSIHMTGSDRTYEAIVFGLGPQGQQRKAEQRPLCTKPFTAELGNIAPAIIVPGPWSESDIHYQAEQLASHLCDSGSYSCSRTRLILQQSSWDKRDALLREIRSVLSGIPPRRAYYPGAIDLYNQFVNSHPDAWRCGAAPEGMLPWTLIPGVESREVKDICFQRESFCPVLSETTLEASSPAEFLTKAVEFTNTHVWGTLTASIIIHPQSLQDPEVSDALEQAIEKLRYGIISINCLPGLAFSLIAPPWGSYPGNDPWNIQSGTGFAHNAYMFSHPQKTVLRGPFRTTPLPPWFPSRANRMAEICQKVTTYEANPSLLRMLDIIISAFR